MPPGHAPAVVLDVGTADTRKVIIGAVVSGVIGLLAVIAGLAGAVDGGTGIAITVIVVGALFLIPGILTITLRRKVFRPRRLVFEPAGLRWDDPQGAPWAIPWRELAAVSVEKHTPIKVSQNVGERLAEATADKMIGERGHLWLDLHPADPGFAARHPELAHLWTGAGYRLPLGGNMRFIPLIADAMSRFAPRIYCGVNKRLG